MRGRRNWREARARNARALSGRPPPLSLEIRLLTNPLRIDAVIAIEADRGVNYTQFNSLSLGARGELVGEFKL
jgi:hypothetical protein